MHALKVAKALKILSKNILFFFFIKQSLFCSCSSLCSCCLLMVCPQCDPSILQPLYSGEHQVRSAQRILLYTVNGAAFLNRVPGDSPTQNTLDVCVILHTQFNRELFWWVELGVFGWGQSRMCGVAHGFQEHGWETLHSFTQLRNVIVNPVILYSTKYRHTVQYIDFQKQQTHFR